MKRIIQAICKFFIAYGEARSEWCRKHGHRGWY